MMMYEDSGLEPEADYDDEYTVATSSSGNSVPAYYPKSQTNSFTDNRHIETETHKYAQILESNQMMDKNQNSHIYHQFEPKIQQVFEEYDPQVVNGRQYVETRLHHQSKPQEKFGQERVLSGHQTHFVADPTTLAVASTSSSSLPSSSSSDISSATPVTVPTKMASLVVSGVIPTLQLPTTRIPKKKKPEVEQLNVPMENGTMLRINTEEGWRQMNALLENSGMDSNSEKLIELLKQCLQADINMNLLTSNNTPKIVKKLSKNHQNVEVRKIAAQCVTKWKKEITANPKDKKSKRNMEVESPPDVKKTEKRRLSEETEKSERRKGKSTPAASKDDEQTAEAKKRKLEAAKKPENPKVAPPKVQPVSLSTGFIDALNNIEQTPKRQPRKKVQPKVVDPLSVLDVMNDEKPKQVPVPVEVRRKSPTPPADEIPVKANRKIKFADECGKEMVVIRYFEIEEGERINVNRLSPEEMKHHEAMMERKFKQDNVVVEEEDEKEISWRLLPLDDSMLPTIDRGCKSEAKIIEERRQMSSLRAFCDPSEIFYITEDPEDYDPNVVLPDPPLIPVYTEKELLLQKAQAAVAAPTPTAAPAQKPEEKALPDNLKNLLDGLKKQGIVGGGPGPSTSSLSNLIPGLSTILGQTNSQPAAAPTYTQAPIVQPQYQQMPQQQFQFPPPQYQQQFAPQAALQPNISSMPGGRLPQRSGNTMMGRPALLCHQFKNGNCRFGDRCKFSHDLNATYVPRNRNDTFRGHGRPYDRNDRRDFRDRRDYRDSREYRDRERDHPDRTSADSAFSPTNAQSPRTILSPTDATRSSTNEPTITAIPSERVD